MNVVIFGATEMVGSGVLIECLEDPRVRFIHGSIADPLLSLPKGSALLTLSS